MRNRGKNLFIYYQMQKQYRGNIRNTKPTPLSSETLSLKANNRKTAYKKYSAAAEVALIVTLLPVADKILAPAFWASRSRISSGVRMGVQLLVFHGLLHVFQGTDDRNESNIK